MSGEPIPCVERMRPAPDPPPPSYPSLATQAMNALGAIGRAIGAAVAGEPIAAPADEQARRLAICEACDRFDRAQGRCTLCGCAAKWKKKLATESCPKDPPLW